LAPEVRRKTARAAFDGARDALVNEELARIPVERLKETTEGRVRFGLVEAAGYKTVAQALTAGSHRLQLIHGVGPETATKIIGAARQLASALRDSVRVRFDPVGRTSLHTELLGHIWAFAVASNAIRPFEQSLRDLVTDLDPLIGDASRGGSRVKLALSSPKKRRAVREALDALDVRFEGATQAGLLAAIETAMQELQRPVPPPHELWSDYETRAALYNGVLIEIAELAPDLAATQGFIPAEIAARVNEHPLDTSMLKDVSLRGYQAFGAKFSLCQRRAMLGDEMGLGKTIEALAAFSHLRVEGASHFLVVCPASVLVNWTHEVRRHSHLEAYRLHGAELRRNQATWVRNGGIGVTTYQALSSVALPDHIQLAMLVVDEAHYAKNPKAQRSLAVASWTPRADRVLFMTGTPMENRVGEFRALVAQLQPQVAASVQSVDGLAGATRFRRAVAPVYLRRNQRDVLEELPDKIETQEWVELAGADLDAYREAVASRNFMAMRRAAYAPGTSDGSAKLERLHEIADEALTNGRKCVVFSYFRDVLAAVAQVLGDSALGPLTGSVPPIARQALVDEFSGRDEPAVLVSQIEAGGVGVNMQAASVVILTEPQWKPSIESQAIARCHRMGQVRPVDVHRLLAEDSVDERMLEVLAEKRVLIDEYVDSDVTRASPDAVDVSDVETTKQAASQAEAERRIIEIERKRLGISDWEGATEGDSPKA
jgi:superfamily II DNA or RNA helicase